jgi:hypothetical protein
MYKLTPNQQRVIAGLRAKECWMTAMAAERAWSIGEKYYIDDRVPVSEWLRAQFREANEERGPEDPSIKEQIHPLMRHPYG